mgnify:CR=1 FL=1
MSKFLSVYVNAASIAGGENLIPAYGVINVLQTSATVVTINFRDAAAGFETVALTHTALPAYAAATPEKSRAMRNLFADAIKQALSTGWTSPSYTLVVPAYPEIEPAAGTNSVSITAITWS